jgi:hypothetical protein
MVEALDDFTIKITFNEVMPNPYAPLVGGQLSCKPLNLPIALAQKPKNVQRRILTPLALARSRLWNSAPMT